MRRLGSGLLDVIMALVIVTSLVLIGNIALEWGGNEIIIQ
jgi:hypothetical protein